MAKTIETPVTEEQATAAPAVLTFRDLLYTSRTLVVPGTERTYPVAKSLVDVPESDKEALAFLKGSSEYAAQEG
ncbi:hypothetical protein SAMN04515675_0035 [Pseudomonas costantinii]|uniref:Uncharacterized protein n=2 Tax=Pseudomonas costantinii TaxID=168469 RepID=A0A1H4U2E1_9PSED|nr:hypothetical protein [Pseudomonas costantinii]SEC62889.1 hypothetical protein SAMN04515675_0035 [Pseudomonas costantinii]